MAQRGFARLVETGRFWPDRHDQPTEHARTSVRAANPCSCSADVCDLDPRGHFCLAEHHNEVNADNSNDQQAELHGSVQAGSGSAGNRAELQDFGGGEELGYWREFVASLAPAIGRGSLGNAPEYG